MSEPPRIMDELLAQMAADRFDSIAERDNIVSALRELQHWRKYHRKGWDLPVGISLDVEKYGIGFAAVTMSGMSRLEPSCVTFTTPHFPAQSAYPQAGRYPGADPSPGRGQQRPSASGPGVGAPTPGAQPTAAQLRAYLDRHLSDTTAWHVLVPFADQMARLEVADHASR